MLRDLNEQIVQKDAFIKKQEDDMKFYKLELINREQSYNQMFGTTPTIGGNQMGAMGGIGGKPPIINQGAVKQSKMGMMNSNNPNMQSKKVL